MNIEDFIKGKYRNISSEYFYIRSLLNTKFNLSLTVFETKTLIDSELRKGSITLLKDSVISENSVC